MFILADMTSVKLTNVQTRQEHHGEALVPAIDLSITLTGTNRIFDMIHADLREGLYTKLAKPSRKKKKGKDEEEPQDEMDLPVDDLPNIRFPGLKYPLKWDREQTGMTAVIDYGLGGKSNITLSMCTAKKFETTPIEGGSGEIHFTLSSAADIDEKIIGKLSLQQQREISLTLTGGSASAGTEGQQMEPEGAWPFPGEGGDKAAAKAAAKEEAGDLFAAAHRKELDAAAKKTPAKKKGAAKTPAAKKPAAKKAAAKKAPAKKAAKKAAAKPTGGDDGE